MGKYSAAGISAVAVSATVATIVGVGHAATGCKPRIYPYGGARAQVFCGPAKATVRLAGKTVRFRQGKCTKTGQYFTINVGTVVMGQTSKRPPNYFGITVGAFPGSSGKPAGKDGTYTGGVVSVVTGGRAYLLDLTKVRITLKAGRKRGTFSGPMLAGPGTAKGSFSC